MTTATTRRIFGAATVTALLLMTMVSVGAAPTQSTGTYLEIDIESGGDTQTVKLSLATERLRMDGVAAPGGGGNSEEGISLVSIGGEGGKMLMIQHAEQQYLEFSTEMMAMMAGAMGRMPPQIEEEIENATPPTFVRTGNTKQVGEWNAYEVRVEHPEQDSEMIMWFSEDVDADFRALAEQVIDSMSSILNSPMAQMGGAGGGEGMFAQIQAQMDAQDMPDGFPVQIISNAGGMESTNTLRAIDQSANFGPETWEAPAGYSKMAMPFMRN